MKYLMYMPNPLIDVSKFSIGLLIRLDLPHKPRKSTSQHSGIPKNIAPVLSGNLCKGQGGKGRATGAGLRGRP